MVHPCTGRITSDNVVISEKEISKYCIRSCMMSVVGISVASKVCLLHILMLSHKKNSHVLLYIYTLLFVISITLTFFLFFVTYGSIFMLNVHHQI
jgi:hypothetical protein